VAATVVIEATATLVTDAEEQPAEVAGSIESPPAIDEAAVHGASLTNSRGETQEAVRGSYCWEFPEEGGVTRSVCADAVGLLVPDTALVLQPDELVTFTLRAENPQQISMRVLQWQPSSQRFPVPEGTVAVDFEAPLLASGTLDPLPFPTWQAPPEPGEYVLDMNAVFKRGSITYGWHIVVQ
jgi:hypothetical protein